MNNWSPFWPFVYMQTTKNAYSKCRLLNLETVADLGISKEGFQLRDFESLLIFIMITDYIILVAIIIIIINNY